MATIIHVGRKTARFLVETKLQEPHAAGKAYTKFRCQPRHKIVNVPIKNEAQDE